MVDTGPDLVVYVQTLTVHEQTPPSVVQKLLAELAAKLPAETVGPEPVGFTPSGLLSPMVTLYAEAKGPAGLSEPAGVSGGMTTPPEGSQYVLEALGAGNGHSGVWVCPQCEADRPAPGPGLVPPQCPECHTFALPVAGVWPKTAHAGPEPAAAGPGEADGAPGPEKGPAGLTGPLKGSGLVCTCPNKKGPHWQDCALMTAQVTQAVEDVLEELSEAVKAAMAAVDAKPLPVSETCDVCWGSHGCDKPAGHDVPGHPFSAAGLSHVCDWGRPTDQVGNGPCSEVFWDEAKGWLVRAWDPDSGQWRGTTEVEVFHAFDHGAPVRPPAQMNG